MLMTKDVKQLLFLFSFSFSSFSNSQLTPSPGSERIANRFHTEQTRLFFCTFREFFDNQQTAFGSPLSPRQNKEKTNLAKEKEEETRRDNVVYFGFFVLILAWIASRAGIECFFLLLFSLIYSSNKLKNPKTKQTTTLSVAFSCKFVYL